MQIFSRISTFFQKFLFEKLEKNSQCCNATLSSAMRVCKSRGAAPVKADIKPFKAMHDHPMTSTINYMMKILKNVLMGSNMTSRYGHIAFLVL